MGDLRELIVGEEVREGPWARFRKAGGCQEMNLDFGLWELDICDGL